MAPPGGGQHTSLLDVLKKKMRQAREEADTARDEADEVKKLLTEEKKRREEVCFALSCALKTLCKLLMYF
jgi:uncharacterized coiled-coil DUF342 family protein